MTDLNDEGDGGVTAFVIDGQTPAHLLPLDLDVDTVTLTWNAEGNIVVSWPTP